MVNGTGYTNSSTVQVTIAANASGNPRIDTIVLRKTFASQIIRVAILQGTPAATPVPVALTQTGATWEIPLAEIAVANGFATITDSVITPRANYMIAPDGVYLEKVLNNGPSSSMVFGDLVMWDTTADRAVKQSNASYPLFFPQVAGAFGARTPVAGYGRVQNRGIGYVRSSSAAVRGQYGYSSPAAAPTTGWSDYPTVSTFCRALAASVAAPGGFTTLVMMDAHIHTAFGLVATSRLSGAAAAITLSNLEFHDTLIIEFYLRSAVAAATDTVNLRFGTGGGVDTTAANYFSYRSSISAAAGTTVGAENLGATAGIQFFIPGSTGTPANAFAYGVLQVNNVLRSAQIKHASGAYGAQTTVLAGGMFTNFITGRWLNVTGVLSQLSLISNGGSNLAAESYISVYAKQTSGD